MLHLIFNNSVRYIGRGGRVVYVIEGSFEEVGKKFLHWMCSRIFCMEFHHGITADCNILEKAFIFFRMRILPYFTNFYFYVTCSVLHCSMLEDILGFEIPISENLVRFAILPSITFWYVISWKGNCAIVFCLIDWWIDWLINCADEFYSCLFRAL